MSQYRKFLFLAGVLLISISASAQTKVHLEQADRWVGGTRNGESFQKFVGNVIFKQRQTTIYCDSAIIYRRNDIVEAYGRVRIHHGDSTIITSKRATYNGNNRIAKLRQNVVFTKLNSMTLYTDNLDYDLNRDVANYFDGGRLVDSVNVLTSVRGTYEDISGMATFQKDVVATFPEFVLNAEALKYNTRSEVVYFIVPTTLVNQDSTVITYNEGEYNTRSKRSQLRQGQIESEEYIIKGEQLYANELLKTYQAVGNVILESKDDDIIITGDEALMDDLKKISKVYGKPLMKKPFEGDTLYLTADTLVSLDSEIETEKRLLAYSNVKIYKSNLQGKADSLTYLPADSLLRLFYNPVLWSEDNQMSADTITIFIANNNINRMEMDINSFVISQDTLENFNQIKGRNMVSYFREGELSKVTVDGNCESIFFALDEEEQYVVGMNKIICSNMIIYFQNNAASKISSLVRPDASFTPPHELKEGDKKLRDFNWLINERPSLHMVLNNLDDSANEPETPEKKTPEILKPANPLPQGRREN